MKGKEKNRCLLHLASGSRSVAGSRPAHVRVVTLSMAEAQHSHCHVVCLAYNRTLEIALYLMQGLRDTIPGAEMNVQRDRSLTPG